VRVAQDDARARGSATFNGAHQIGGSDTVVASDNYFRNGTDDILFRSNSKGGT
jgi:hypothetical protein